MAFFPRVASFSLLFFATSLFANPSVQQIAHGNVQILQNGPEMTIHASHKSIIDYHSFDIGKNEQVTFIQPYSRACVLNRIHSASPSSIEGSLKSNGILYLVNPAGIIFGKNSTIDVGGILAAAAHISEKDFLNGTDRFSQVAGNIKQLGKMSSETFVRLIGKQVENQGEIIAKEDTSIFSAQEQLLLGKADGHTFLLLQKEQTAALPLGSGDLFSLAIQNKGEIQSSQIVLQAEKGKVEVSGHLNVSNAYDKKGGNIALLGDEIAIKSAMIDAHGKRGGGEIFIGGSREGRGPLPNATITSLDSESSLLAQATLQGNGGKIFFFAQDTATFLGSVDISAGRTGGDGGFVEVSGKKNASFPWKSFKGDAPFGKSGLCFTDPTAFTVDENYVATQINPVIASGADFSASANDLITIDASFFNIATAPFGHTVTFSTTNAGSKISFVHRLGLFLAAQKLIFITPPSTGIIEFTNTFEDATISATHVEFHGSKFSWELPFSSTIDIYPYVDTGYDGEILFDLPIIASDFPDQAFFNLDTVHRTPGASLVFNGTVQGITVNIFSSTPVIANQPFSGTISVVNPSSKTDIKLLNGGALANPTLNFVNNLYIYGGVSNLTLPQNFSTDASTVHISGTINLAGPTNLVFPQVILDNNTTIFTGTGSGGFQSQAISASNPAYTLTINGGSTANFGQGVAIGALTLNDFRSVVFASDLILQNDCTITASNLTNVSISGRLNANNVTILNSAIPANIAFLGGGTITGTLTTGDLINSLTLHASSGTPFIFGNGLPAGSILTTHLSGPLQFTNNANITIQNLILDGDSSLQGSLNPTTIGGISDTTASLSLGTALGNLGNIFCDNTVTLKNLSIFSGSSASFAFGTVSLQNFFSNAPVTAQDNFIVSGTVQMASFVANGATKNIQFLSGGTISEAATFSNTGALDLFGGVTPLTFGQGFNASAVPETITAGTLVFLDASPILIKNLRLNTDTSFQGDGGNVTINGDIDPITKNFSLGTSGHSMGAITCSGRVMLTDFSVFASSIIFSQAVDVRNYISTAPVTAHDNFIVKGLVQMPAFTADGAIKDVEFLNGGTISGAATFNNTGALDLFGGVTPLTFGQGFNALAIPTTVTSGTLAFLDASPILMNSLFLNGDTSFQGAGGNLTIGGIIIPATKSLSLGTSGHLMGAISCSGTITLNDFSVFSTSSITFPSAVTVHNYTANVSSTAHDNFTTSGVVQMAAFSADGIGKNIRFLHGGTIVGTTSFANDLGSIVFGSIDPDSFFLQEPLNLGSFTGTLTLTGTLQTADKPIDLGSAANSFTIPKSASILSLFNAGGANIVFHSTIDGPGPLDIDAGAHLVQFFGSVGEINSLSLLESTALSNEIHTPLIHTGGGTLIFNGNTQLFMPTTFLDNGSTGIFFNGTLNGSFDLTLATFGAIAFLQDVGTTNPLGNVSIDFPFPSVIVHNVTAEGNFFCQSFRQYSGRGESSFVSMNTSITSGTAGGDINILTLGTISFSGAITTKGGTSVGGVGFNGGNVTLTSSEASIEVADINTSGSDAVLGAGGNAGNVILQPNTDFDSTSFGDLPEGKISLSGNIICLHGLGTPDGSDGDISLDPNGRDTPLAVATIYSKDADSTITLMGKNLTIGTNDSLTTLGSFSGTFSGTAQVGDIVTGNDLNLFANPVVAYRHLPSLILTSSGDLVTNPYVHFIAGNQITLSHQILETGPGDSLERTSFQLSSVARELFVDNLLFKNMVLNFFSNHPDNSLLFSSEPVQMANLLRVDWDLLGETLIDDQWVKIFDQLGSISSDWARSWRSLLKNKRALEGSLLSSFPFSPKEFAARVASSKDTEAFLYVSKLLDLMMRIEFSPYFSSPIRGEEKLKLQNQILQITCPEKISVREWKELLQEISSLKHNSNAARNEV